MTIPKLVLIQLAILIVTINFDFKHSQASGHRNITA